MDKQNNIEMPNVPVIDEFDFYNALFRTGETWGDLWTRVNGSNCNNCPFKEKCDPISQFLDAHTTEMVYCEDLINIMLGHKQIENFI